MMTVDQILAQFAATGVQTCFHGRHINPQIYAGLNGQNWRLRDYETRGGYQALRKILGKDGGEGMSWGRSRTKRSRMSLMMNLLAPLASAFFSKLMSSCCPQSMMTQMTSYPLSAIQRTITLVSRPPEYSRMTFSFLPPFLPAFAGAADFLAMFVPVSAMKFQNSKPQTMEQTRAVFKTRSHSQNNQQLRISNSNKLSPFRVIRQEAENAKTVS